MNTTIAETDSPRSEENKLVLPGSNRPLSADDLTMHLQRCALNVRESQKIIYQAFFDFSIAICSQYVNSEEAVEVLNDGFLKVFTNVHRFQPAYADTVSSFKGWLRRIMISTAIDHYRKNKKHIYNKELDDGVTQVSDTTEDAVDKISYQEILKSIQLLSPVYKSVLNLFIIHGRTHEEISRQLNISIGTSKSNLAKARVQLQKILLVRNHIVKK
jgi:RNA polymerase sigma-70 factor (ECF subfamily)